MIATRASADGAQQRRGRVVSIISWAVLASTANNVGRDGGQWDAVALREHRRAIRGAFSYLCTRAPFCLSTLLLWSQVPGCALIIALLVQCSSPLCGRAYPSFASRNRASSSAIGPALWLAARVTLVALSAWLLILGLLVLVSNASRSPLATGCQLLNNC